MISAARAFHLSAFGLSYQAGDPIHLKSEDQPDGLEQVQIDKLLRQGLARDSTKPYEAPKAKQPIPPAGVKAGASKGKNAPPKVDEE